MRRFERDTLPWPSGRLITEIKAPALLASVRRIASRDAPETAHRALDNCRQVFLHALAIERAERDFSTDLRGALQSVKDGHFAAVTDPQRVAELLRAFNGYQGTLTVCYALKLAPLVFSVRENCAVPNERQRDSRGNASTRYQQGRNEHTWIPGNGEDDSRRSTGISSGFH